MTIRCLRRITVYLNTLELYSEYLNHLSPAQLDRVTDSLARLKYVTGTWWGHVTAVEAHLDTADFKVAARRTQKLEEKIRNTCIRWSKVRSQKLP